MTFPCHHHGGGVRGIAPLILDLCARCRRMVNYMPRPLYPVKESLYQLNRTLGGLQSRYGLFGEEKILFSCRESNPGPASPKSRHCTNRAIPVPIFGPKWEKVTYHGEFMDRRPTMQRTGMQFVRLLQLHIISS